MSRTASADSRVTDILDQLSAKGMRRTSARQAILEAFFAAETHVTAEDIAAEVQRHFPSVDVSTVYRTFDTLEQLGIIDHTHLAHGPAIFHLADDDHQHLVCERCGRVEEVAPEKLEPFLETLKAEFDFDVDRRHFALVGICGVCRAGPTVSAPATRR